jgi:hypothetical protein
MIFWLVLKFEINYYRVIMSWRILVSFGGFVLKITFLHGEILLSQISMTLSTKLKTFCPNDLKLDLQPRLELANIVIHIHSPTTKVVQIKWWWITITIWRSTCFICKVYFINLFIKCKKSAYVLNFFEMLEQNAHKGGHFIFQNV